MNAYNSLSFELVLLDRMSSVYKMNALLEMGLTEAEAKQLRDTCVLKYPDLAASNLETFRRILGPETPGNNQLVANRERRPGCTPHHFVLMIWPHLFFVVEEFHGANSCGIGFENQAAIRAQTFDPRAVRGGIWTRRALEMLADRHEVRDGWDEEVVVRFAFGDRMFEGRFVLGLLQEWIDLSRSS